MENRKLDVSTLVRIFGDEEAPNGGLARDNFEKWFGDSKAVSPLGEPLVVHHGSNTSFDAFHSSERGTFGPGIYFALEEKSAKDYVHTENGLVYSVYVKTENPLIYYANSDHDIDLDSPAVSLIQELFDPVMAQQLLHNALWSDGLFGPEVQRELIKRGYDGVIAIHEDSSCEVVVFSPEQVKSVNNSGNFTVGDPSISDRLLPRATEEASNGRKNRSALRR
jgi:hypothetical protein